MGRWGKSVGGAVVFGSALFSAAAGVCQSTPPQAPPPLSIVNGNAMTSTIRAPIGKNLAAIVNNDDYPPEAIRAGEQGVVGFAVDVDPNGEPSDCSIIQSSGSAALDRRTCEVVLARAHFKPSLDAKGVPVGGQFRSRIRWILPKSVPSPNWGHVTFVDKGGTMTCLSSVHGAPPHPLTDKECDQLVTGIRAAANYLPQSVDFKDNPAPTASGQPK